MHNQENFFESLFQQANTPIAVLKSDDPYFTILAANQQYKVTTGIDDAALGKSAFEVFKPQNEAAEKHYQTIIQGLRTAIACKEEVCLPVLSFEKPSSDGHYTASEWWQIAITPVTKTQNTVECLMCVTRNVTEQERIRQAAEAAKIKEANLAEELAASNEELAATNEELTATVEEVRQAQEELSALNESLEERIRERTMKLSQREASLNSLVMTAHFPLMILRGNEWLIEIANPQIANLWQKPLEDITGRLLMDVLPEIKDQPFPRLLKDVFDSGIPYSQKEEIFSLHTEHGIVNKYISFYYDPMFDEAGAVTGIIVAADDISEKVEARLALEKSHKAEQALNEELTAVNKKLGTSNKELRVVIEELDKVQGVLHQTIIGLEESEGRFQNLVRDATVGIIVLVGEELEVAIVNDAYSRLIGRNATDLKGRHLFEVIPEAEEGFRPILDNVRMTGEPVYLYDHPYFVFDSHGNQIDGYLNLVYQPYREADGTVSGVIVLCQDVTEQLVARRQIEENEQRFRFLLNAMPQQVWTADINGALDYVNNNVINDFGQSQNEIVGQGWQAFIHPDDLPNTLQKWQHALTTGTEYQVEFRLKFKDGSYRWHLTRALPLIEEGQIKLWLGTNTDIDQQKLNEQKKDEFLSIASHELKTPLTSIKAFNQLMRRIEDPQKLNGFVGKSAEHITRLEKLINDLLDVTKINAGKMEYTMQSFNFQNMVAESVESVQLTAPQHEIIVESEADVNYIGDRFRLEQVVNNFLTNAVKYSPGGERVLVNCKVEQGNIVLSVRDFGIGIAQEHIDRLFDRYYRVDNTAMRFEGLGLGLFISSEILKRHSGSFWIESEQDKGSTFYFRLPLANHKEVKPARNTEVFYQDSTITIAYNETERRLDVDWTGFQDMDSVQRGCMVMLDMILHNKCHKVVNDNRNVQGTWSEAAEWVGQEWMPMMEKAGLQYFAWIFSPSTFSQLSAKKSIDVMQGNVVTQFFTDVEAAEAWLNSR